MKISDLLQGNVPDGTLVRLSQKNVISVTQDRVVIRDDAWVVPKVTISPTTTTTMTTTAPRLQGIPVYMPSEPRPPLQSVVTVDAKYVHFDGQSMLMDPTVHVDRAPVAKTMSLRDLEGRAPEGMMVKLVDKRVVSVAADNIVLDDYAATRTLSNTTGSTPLYQFFPVYMGSLAKPLVGSVVTLEAKWVHVGRDATLRDPKIISVTPAN
jgi:hypothetical protein